MPEDRTQLHWSRLTVSSPNLPQPVSVIAKRFPYFHNANRLQYLSIYLPDISENSKLIGTGSEGLLNTDAKAQFPRWLVHIHGGAWRASGLTSISIEPTVAHAYGSDSNRPTGIIGLNYSLSPTEHPLFKPYDPLRDNHSDPAREALHPDHVRDIFHGFSLLRSLGLKDDSYILTGHSAGACLSLQAMLQPPAYYGFEDLPSPPRPAALLGFNGLYDLDQLVHGLGSAHAQMKDDYKVLLSTAFRDDEKAWPAASPARFDVDDIAMRVKKNEAPRLIMLDQSAEDQLVPMNQLERMLIQLRQVEGMEVLKGQKCTGLHSAPWEEGYMIWESVQAVLQLLDRRQQ